MYMISIKKKIKRTVSHYVVYCEPGSFLCTEHTILLWHQGRLLLSPKFSASINEKQSELEMIGVTTEFMFHFSHDTSGTFPEHNY